jgi:hypothetical protein
MFTTSMLLLMRNARWLFRRSIVVDGNFSAEHLKMPRAEKDVRLSNGEGFIVEEVKYQKHLSEGLGTQDVGSNTESLTHAHIHNRNQNAPIIER